MRPASIAASGKRGGAVGRVALSIIGAIVAIQVVLRVLYRLLPTRMLPVLTSALDQPVRQQFLGPITVARRTGIRSGMRVLHLGPGDGPLIQALAQTVGGDGRIEAVALDSDGLDRARAHLDASRVENASVIPGDGTRLPFEDTSFDAVCVVSGLGRVGDPRRMLNEISRVLRPAGRFSTSDVVSDLAYHLQSTVVKWGESAGFEPLEHFGNAIAYTVNFRKPRVEASAG